MTLNNGIRITWLGHSTFRIDHDGHVIVIEIGRASCRERV